MILKSSSVWLCQGYFGTEQTDPLEILNDDEFRQLYRLSRRGFYHVLSMVSDELFPDNAQIRISIERL